MALDKSWIDLALAITGDFETTGDPFAGVTGDFDGMGLSCGVLQWCIGQGSLQPLVRGAGKAAVLAAMPKYGNDFWLACNSDVVKGLAIVRGWQTNKVLDKGVRKELETLMASKPLREQQSKAAEGVARQAYDLAKLWCRDSTGAAEPDLRSFCWYFDLVTQNGGPKGLTFKDVTHFIAAHGTASVDDVLADWLAATGPAMAGWKDSRQNARLWRDQIPASRLPLVVLSYLRALKARSEYQAVVFNRKGSIAFGSGWVNGEKMVFQQLP